jgi:hypothetical protein
MNVRIMKAKYAQPTVEVILIKGRQQFLADSQVGVTATMSGYEEDTESGSGFSQYDE